MKNTTNWKRIILIICLVLLVAGIGVISYEIARNIANRRANDVVRQIAFAGTIATPTPEETPGNEADDAIIGTDSDSETAETEPEYPSAQVSFQSIIDFVALQRINSDIFSWIEVPGTVISYPVLQHAGDYQYYLRRNLEGQSNNDGCLFTENTVAQDYSDFVTVIYGHHLRSGQMFGCLDNYADEEYFDEHRVITIYTPYRTLTYTVFATNVHNDQLLSATYDFATEEGRQYFLDYISNSRNMNNIVKTDVEVNTDSNILVLSTCNGDRSERFLVLAVLTDIQE